MTFDAGPTHPLPHQLRHDVTPDILDAIPPGAAERLRALRQRVEDLHALCPPFELRHAASTAKAEAAARLKRLRDHPAASGFNLRGDDGRVVAAEQELERLADEHERLTRINDTRSRAWTAASHLQSACEAWLRDGKPGGVVLLDFDGPPPTLKGSESPVDAIARLQRRGRELKADLRRIASSCFPASHCKAQMRAQIERLAAQGAPDVADLIEHDREVTFPTQQVRCTVYNTGTPAVGFAEVIDSAAVFAWTFRDALIAKLDALIDAESDEGSAMSHEVREQRAAEVASDLLDIERQEAALMFTAWGDGVNIEPRGDLDPVAVLNVELVSARASIAETTPGHAYDVAGARRR
jgi:hypothetical protein